MSALPDNKSKDEIIITLLTKIQNIETELNALKYERDALKEENQKVTKDAQALSEIVAKNRDRTTELSKGSDDAAKKCTELVLRYAKEIGY